MSAGISRGGVGNAGVGMIGSTGVGTAGDSDVESSAMDASDVIVAVGSCSAGREIFSGCRLISSIISCSSVAEGTASWSGWGDLFLSGIGSTGVAIL